MDAKGSNRIHHVLLLRRYINWSVYVWSTLCKIRTTSTSNIMRPLLDIAFFTPTIQPHRSISSILCHLICLYFRPLSISFFLLLSHLVAVFKQSKMAHKLKFIANFRREKKRNWERYGGICHIRWCKINGRNGV